MRAVSHIGSVNERQTDSDAWDRGADHWLGTHSPIDATRHSGLWNIDHVDESYDPAVLDYLTEHVSETKPL